MMAESHDERVERFRELNDRVWGAGNWYECEWCLDGEGKPSFHHVEFHDAPVVVTPRL